MKKVFYAVVVTIVVVMSALFAYLNHQTVSIRYYGGLDAEIELSLLLFIAFVAGMICTAVVGLLRHLRLRLRLAAANKQIRLQQDAAN